MSRYSIEAENQIFVKGCRFFFGQNKSTNIGKKMSQNLKSKSSQKLLDYAKKSVTDAESENKKQQNQLVIGNKIAGKYTKNSSHNNGHFNFGLKALQCSGTDAFS